MARRRKLYGIDGCAGGWLMATLKEWDKCPVLELHSQLLEGIYDGRKKDIICIDIPIGLPDGRSADSAQRACDMLARKKLPGCASRVFPAPIRPTLKYADQYAKANACSRRISGKGLSKQAFHILPKIKEVDDLIQAGVIDPEIHEVHPELSFACMNGSRKTPLPVLESKASMEGHGIRTELLPKPWRKLIEQAPEILGPKSIMIMGRTQKVWAMDDVVDALACLWTAMRLAGISRGKPICLPKSKHGQKDPTGLLMQIQA